MKVLFCKADRKTSQISRGRGCFLCCAACILLWLLFVVLAGPNVWCEEKQEVIWKDYRKPFEQDILVSPLSTVRVNVPEEFFKEEKIILSVTTDATPHSEPKVSIGAWEKDLSALLTPPEYFKTLILTETINLEIPTRHFQKGENKINFHSITDSPDDEYTITKLEFAMFREKVVAIPRTQVIQKVPIAVVGEFAREYFPHLREIFGKRSDIQLLEVPEVINYDQLNIDTAKVMKQKYQVDMVIGVKNLMVSMRGGELMYTKLVDISAERVLTLDQIKLGLRGYYGMGRQRLKKKILSEQIGPIQEMIDQILQEKLALAAAPAEPEALEKVRIGISTYLQPQYESKYQTHLEEVLGKRPDLQVFEIPDPIDCAELNADNATSMRQEYQIDMVICVRDVFTMIQHGFIAYTRLVDIPAGRIVELDPIDLDAYRSHRTHFARVEKKLLSKQIGPIEEMIGEISREKSKSK